MKAKVYVYHGGIVQVSDGSIPWNLGRQIIYRPKNIDALSKKMLEERGWKPMEVATEQDIKKHLPNAELKPKRKVKKEVKPESNLEN